MTSKTWHPCVLKVARIVTEETGNRVEEKNLNTIETRLRSRLLRLGLKDFEAYETHLAAHELEERVALKGLMTTHHTFFFREFQHFDVLQEWIASKVSSGEWKSGSSVKVWSAAASRGQEAYSLAMFLHVHLKKAHGIDFKVFASDIDGESVRYGSNGVYPVKEVQAIPLAYLGGLWARGTGDIAHFAKAKAVLRDKISWHEVNLLDAGKFTREHGPFDVVFCRNVFIYFEPEKVLSISRDLLGSTREGGLFVTGLSEPVPAEPLGLSKVGPSCYRTASSKVPLPKAKGALAPAPKFSPAPAAPLRVLVVDDSPTIQKLLKKILLEDTLFGTVDVASHGEEARKLLASGSYDLITLDIHMPVMGGVEFLEKVYDRKSHPPVLVVSSVSREDRGLATRVLELGARDYVEKPDLSRMKESADEIRSKAKTLAKLPKATTSLELDRSFSREVVIPEVDRKLRVVEVGSGLARVDVAALSASFDLESHSPPTIWVFADAAEAPALAEKIRRSSKRAVHLLSGDSELRSDAHYVCSTAEFASLVQGRLVREKRGVSALLSSSSSAVVAALEKTAPVYVLTGEASDVSKLRTFSWVEQAPATSYVSLSAEVFAGIRKVRKELVA